MRINGKKSFDGTKGPSVLDTIPVMSGYIVLGIGFGVIMVSNGLSPVLAICMSLFIYAGSLQYVGIGLLTGGASYITVALTTLAVNARHLFYGISMVAKYRNIGAAKPYLIFSLTDETYALVSRDLRITPPKKEQRYYLMVSVLDHCYWVLGTVIGVIIGKTTTFDLEGIDFALTALFITIFTDQWIKTKNHFPAIIGLVASVVCLIAVGTDGFLIPSMILIAAALVAMRKRFEADSSDLRKGADNE